MTALELDGLTLPEKIVLLALHDQKGTASCCAYSNLAIGGALLAELNLLGRIEIEPERKRFVNVIDSAPIGDPILDDCLKRIVEAKRRARAETWVGRFAQDKIKHQLARHLCAKGVLREDQGRVLLIFRRTIYPELDPAPERELVSRLSEAIFRDEPAIDPETLIILALAHETSLLAGTFDKKDLKRRKDHIDSLIENSDLSHAARRAVEAAQAAAAAAVAAAIVVTTVS